MYTSKKSQWTRTVLILRLLCMVSAFLFFYNIDTMQENVDYLWAILYDNPFYRLSYFETIFVVGFYTSFLWIPIILDYSGVFNQYKTEPKERIPLPTPSMYILETLIYVAPLATMDTFMVKKYAGITEDDLVEVRKSWIQTERILPHDPPNVTTMVLHLVLSFIIYDFLIFFMHFSLHKHRWLYDNIHARHHNHHGLHSRVTNNLHIVERVAIVLTANFALKVIGSHPLTRTVFIPIFVGLLTESHMGYDFPWSYDKIIPFGILGGAKTHQIHHVTGTKNFQPFFTYIDKIVL